MPLVSVIVPVYNAEKTMDRCVQSVLAQTYSDLEIILVDDGSADRSAEYCDMWSKKDERIRVIHKDNGGLSQARNTGLDAAAGELVYFLDSDDYIEPDTIDVLYTLLKENDCDMAMGLFARFSDSGKDYPHPEFTGEARVFDEDSFWNYYYSLYSSQEQIQTGINMIIAANKLIKKSVFETLRFDPGKKHEDEFIIHKIVANCSKSVFVAKLLYHYYQNENGIMATIDKKAMVSLLEALAGRLEYFAKEKKTYTVMAFRAFMYYCDKRLDQFGRDDRRRLLKLYRRALRKAHRSLRALSPVELIYACALFMGAGPYRSCKKMIGKTAASGRTA